MTFLYDRCKDCSESRDRHGCDHCLSCDHCVAIAWNNAEFILLFDGSLFIFVVLVMNDSMDCLFVCSRFVDEA